MTDNIPEPPAPPHINPSGGIAPVWRVILYLPVVGVTYLIFGIFTVLLSFVFPGNDLTVGRGMGISLASLAISYVPLAATIVLITLGFTLFVDHCPAQSLGYNRRGSWKAELWLGIALGFVLPFLIFAVSYIAGWSHVTGSLFRLSAARVTAVIIQILLLMASIAVMEETSMRGYVLRTLKSGYGSVAALVVSSVLFGLFHSANPGTSFSSFLGTTAAGLVLGYAYLATKRLWLPLGFHFAWNFSLGPIFGFPVSGLNLPGWIDQNLVGGSIWTGGKFGPEAGLTGLLAMVVAAGVICAFARTAYRPGEG